MTEKTEKVNKSQIDFLGLPAEEGTPCTHIDCERMRVTYKSAMKEMKEMIDDFKIKICCDAMGDAVMMNDIRDGIAIINDKLYIVWSDGDCMPLNYCPSCGKKIEKVKE